MFDRILLPLDRSPIKYGSFLNSRLTSSQDSFGRFNKKQLIFTRCYRTLVSLLATINRHFRIKNIYLLTYSRRRKSLPTTSKNCFTKSICFSSEVCIVCIRVNFILLLHEILLSHLVGSQSIWSYCRVKRKQTVTLLPLQIPSTLKVLRVTSLPGSQLTDRCAMCPILHLSHDGRSCGRTFRIPTQGNELL